MASSVQRAPRASARRSTPGLAAFARRGDVGAGRRMEAGAPASEKGRWLGPVTPAPDL
jgi:hypothetical protein